MAIYDEKHTDHHNDHSTPTYVFIRVYAALMVLLLTTVGAAGLDLTRDLPLHIPGMNVVVMLAIAIVKASLVVLYFMEVKKGTKLTWLWAATGFVWVVLLFMTFGDYFTRGWQTVLGW